MPHLMRWTTIRVYVWSSKFSPTSERSINISMLKLFSRLLSAIPESSRSQRVLNVPKNKTSPPSQSPIYPKMNKDIPAAMMTSLFALTLYFCPPNTNSTALASLGTLTVLQVGLGLEQNPGGFGASEHDKVFSVGIWLEIPCEQRLRGLCSRSRLDSSGRSEEASGVASFIPTVTKGKSG